MNYLELFQYLWLVSFPVFPVHIDHIYLPGLLSGQAAGFTLSQPGALKRLQVDSVLFGEIGAGPSFISRWPHFLLRAGTSCYCYDLAEMPYCITERWLRARGEQ